MKRTMAWILAALMGMTVFCAPAMADSSASTRIYDTSKAYLNNVDLAIAMLDGCEVWADEEFSFNDVVGPRTRDEGYQVAENGRGTRAMGGGVSQVATTLYLALEERGDVDYIEKSVYGSKFTGEYVSSGRDAIVTDYKNDNDFSFLNTGDTFTIEIYRSGKSIYCSLNDVDDWDDDDDWTDDWGDDDGWNDGWGGDEYIFPHSSTRKLTRSQISAIPRAMWGYARNEIYARHGYEFKTRKYRDYFMSQDWYEPGGFSVKDLNSTEWYNMDLIKEMEENGGDSYDEYIFPHSSTRKLTRREILAIPESQWGYARNEIYARHGYVFKTKKYKDYFARQDWYVSGGFDTGDLNATEWYNMDLIKSLEEEYGVG